MQNACDGGIEEAMFWFKSSQTSTFIGKSSFSFFKYFQELHLVINSFDYYLNRRRIYCNEYLILCIALVANVYTWKKG